MSKATTHDRQGQAASGAAKRVMARAVPAPGYPIHRLTVDQYHRLIQSGILREDERVELLDGWLVEKMPQNPPHSGTVHEVARRLQSLLGEAYVVREQSPITTSTSEPEPDVAVVKPPAAQYYRRHPTPKDIELIVEVSDSSIEEDRLKASIYARSRVAVYWLINLPERQIEVFAGPMPRSQRYRSMTVFREADEVPVTIAGRGAGRLPVKDLLPPA